MKVWRKIFIVKVKFSLGKSAEKQANDEREKYLQMYNHTNERFLAFEHKQLDQIRRILNNILTSDQHETLSGKNKIFFISSFLL